MASVTGSQIILCNEFRNNEWARGDPHAAGQPISGETCAHMALRSCYFGLVPLCESVVRGFPKFSITPRATQFA